jgi:microcystin-dependent protein
MDNYLSDIKLFAFSFAPSHWLQCNGQILAINTNTALFSLLGTTYGGDGRTTFGLPDLRGRAAIGQSNQAGNTYVLGQRVGISNETLSVQEMPSHVHVTTLPNPAPALSVKVSSAQADTGTLSAGVTLATMGSVGAARGSQFVPILTSNTSAPDQALQSTATQGITDIKETNTGGSQPHSNMQPYLGLNFCICINGLFPSRP